MPTTTMSRPATSSRLRACFREPVSLRRLTDDIVTNPGGSLPKNNLNGLLIDGLERRWNESGCDPVIGRQIVKVLETRKSNKRNNALKKAIGDGVAIRQGSRVTVALGGGTVPVVAPFDEEPARPVDEVLAEKYEALRSVFSAEGEILARWGMTPSMPLDLRSSVFAEWRAKLASGSASALRTLEVLETDEKTLSVMGKPRA